MAKSTTPRFTKAHRAKLAAAAKARWADKKKRAALLAVRAAAAEANTEGRERQTAAMKKYGADPAWRERRRAASKKLHESAAYRKKRAAGVAAFLADPARVAAWAAARRATLAAKKAKP